MSVDREQWERDRQHEEHLQKVANQSLCAFPVGGGLCQKPLSVAWLCGQHHLRCGSGHIDPPVDRVKSYTELWLNGEPIPIEIAEKIRKKWRRKMRDQMSEDKVTALEQYRGLPTLSQQQADDICKLLWPSATQEARLRAAVICKIYGLNPLMKHVFLIPFKERRTETTKWEVVLGINATRVIANRKGVYSYADGPRIMTQDEQITYRGEYDDKNWWAITVIKGQQGNEARGYGSYPRTGDEPYGSDKGNTRQNMAFIRSERNALERLCPGEMPADVDVVDADFVVLSTETLSPQQAKALPPRTEPRPNGIPPNLVMKTAMDLFGASKRYFNLSQPQVLADLNLTTVQELADVGEAWATIVALHTGPPEG